MKRYLHFLEVCSFNPYIFEEGFAMCNSWKAVLAVAVLTLGLASAEEAKLSESKNFLAKALAFADQPIAEVVQLLPVRLKPVPAGKTYFQILYEEYEVMIEEGEATDPGKFLEEFDPFFYRYGVVEFEPVIMVGGKEKTYQGLRVTFPGLKPVLLSATKEQRIRLASKVYDVFFGDILQRMADEK